MNKKKYSVYRSKAIYGFSDLLRCYYVFIRDNTSEYDESLLYPIECTGNMRRYIGNSCCNGEPPSTRFMKTLEYCGEVDDIYDIDFNL